LSTSSILSIWAFTDIFSKCFNKVFARNEIHHPVSKLPALKIELLPEARPVRVPNHKMAPEEEQMIEDEIAEMAAKGILKEVKNPQSSKWVLALRRSSSLRFGCCDFVSAPNGTVDWRRFPSS
jgi:hypothetical protein